MNKYKIREITPNDFKQVAIFSKNLLNQNLFSALGVTFLRYYYFPQFYYSPNGFVLISVNENNEIIGFLAGSYNFSKQKMFLNYKLIYGLIISFINKPFKFIKTFWHTFATPKIQLDLNNYGKLSSMAIDPKYQGKGVGSRLTSELINRLKNNNIKKCYLSCRVNNEPAIRLYHKHDFIKHRKYKIKNTEFYIMTKSF